MPSLLPEKKVDASYYEGQKAIGEHKKLRVFEECLGFSIKPDVLSGHDFLLQHTPCQIRAHEAQEAVGQ